MLTDFGKLCRKLRIDNNQVLHDMAETLGVAPSFLSSVENGKKNVPDGWCEKIKDVYHLTEAAYKELVKAKENAQIQVKINLQNYTSEDRNLVLAFTRSFEDLDEGQKKKILSILKKGGC